MPDLDCRKTPTGFSDKGLQPAARIICPPMGDKFHTCSLRGIFRQVRAPAENSLTFFAAMGGKLCEAFLISLKIPAASAAGIFWGQKLTKCKFYDILL